MATPRSEVEQSIGRIIRKSHDSLQPIIIDIVDMLPSFVRQGLYRRRLYKKLKYQIKIIDVDNNKIVSENNLSDKKFCDLNKLKTSVKIDNADVDFID